MPTSILQLSLSCFSQFPVLVCFLLLLPLHLPLSHQQLCRHHPTIHRVCTLHIINFFFLIFLLLGRRRRKQTSTGNCEKQERDSCKILVGIIVQSARQAPSMKYTSVAHSMEHTSMAHSMEHTSVAHSMEHTSMAHSMEHTSMAHSMEHTSMEHTSMAHSMEHTSMEHTSMAHSMEHTSMAHSMEHTSMTHSMEHTSMAHSMGGSSIEQGLMWVDNITVDHVTHRNIKYVRNVLLMIFQQYDYSLKPH